MKTIIDAIEQALASHSEWSWKQLGFNPTFGQAYLYSRDAGNDLLNFADTIWDNEIPAILEDCPEPGSPSSRSAAPSPAWSRPSQSSSATAAACRA